MRSKFCSFWETAINIRYPNVNFQECCGNTESKAAFLKECSNSYAPSTCFDVIEGSAIIKILDQTNLIESLLFVDITVQGNVYSSKGAGIISNWIYWLTYQQFSEKIFLLIFLSI